MNVPAVPYRICCDSVVALPPRTRGCRPIFAKNSDRPPDEAQPLFQVAAADHPPGSRLRCQYLEIEQVVHTHAFLGSRPFWLWGCEHGVNEHAVAIGNHTIYTKDSLGESGLQGMDLVRLGLERGATAREAADVITGLIERYGQGGSGFADLMWPYNNSFVIADPREAWLLETSASHWALKRLREGGSASNHTVIGNDWDELSRDCVAHAVEGGWWRDDGGRFDFAVAYRDESVVPAVVSSGRYRATCGALAKADGALDVDAFKRIMRDHYEAGEVHAPGRMPDDERFFSVCMHAGPVGVTAASMIAELGAAPGNAPQPVWVSFCNPCVSPYLPVFLEAPIPADYSIGGRTAEEGGAWWRFKREVWRGFEQALQARAERVISEAAARTGRERAAVLESFMREAWTDTAERLDAITAEIEA
jgi:secernin